MLMTKTLQTLQLIDGFPGNLKDWGCSNNCVKSPCENIDPVTRYVCYKLYTKVL